MKSKLHNNVKIYFWAEFFGAISFLTPVMSFFCLSRGLVYTDIFILMLIWVITVFLFEVPTGAFADRHGPRTSFLLGHSIFLIATSLLLIAHHRWVFYLWNFLSGLSFTFFSGSDQAFIYETLKELDQENKMSRVWGRIQSARLIPAVVTILFGAYWARDLTNAQFIALILLGLTFNSLKFLLLLFVKSPDSFHIQKESHSLTHIRKGFQNIRQSKSLLLLFTNECLVMIPTYVFLADFNLAQPFFKEAGLPIIFIGAVYATDALLSSLILQTMGWFEKQLGQKQLVIITGMGICFGFFAAAFLSRKIAIAISVFFAIKLSLWLRYPVFSHIKNRYIPSKSRTTSLSLLSMIDSAFDVLILGTLGFISKLGMNTIFTGCAVIALIGMIFPVCIIKNPIEEE